MFFNSDCKRRKIAILEKKKKKKVMIDGIQLEDTLYTLHQESQNQNNGNKL